MRWLLVCFCCLLSTVNAEIQFKMATTRDFKLFNISDIAEFKLCNIFDIKDGCIILTTNEVRTLDVEDLMLKNLENFPIGTHFSVFAGSHGSHDGNFGDTTETQRGSMII